MAHADGAAPAGEAPHLDAYKKVIACFMQGEYNLAKEEALAALRSVLSISEAQHLQARKDACAEAAGGGKHGGGQASTSGRPAGGAGVAANGFHSAAGRLGPSPSGAPKPGSKAAPPRKKLKSEGGGVKAARAPPPMAVAAAPGVQIDDLIGKLVMRWWPKDGGWWEGIVSDFRPHTGEHCIIYNLGSKNETYEWYVIRGAHAAQCYLPDQPAPDMRAIQNRLATAGGAKPSQAGAAGAPRGYNVHARAATDGLRAGTGAAGWQRGATGMTPTTAPDVPRDTRADWLSDEGTEDEDSGDEWRG